MLQKLRGRIVEQFGSQRAFATHLGIGESDVSRVIREQNRLSSATIATWAGALNISKPEIGIYFFESTVDETQTE